MSCEDPRHVGRTEVAVIFLIFAMISMVILTLAHSTDEEARYDALDAMCRTYTRMDGGAKQVLSDGRGFYVECQNRTWPAIEWLIVNATVVH